MSSPTEITATLLEPVTPTHFALDEIVMLASVLYHVAPPMVRVSFARMPSPGVNAPGMIRASLSMGGPDIAACHGNTIDQAATMLLVDMCKSASKQAENIRSTLAEISRRMASDGS